MVNTLTLSTKNAWKSTLSSEICESYKNGRSAYKIVISAAFLACLDFVSLTSLLRSSFVLTMQPCFDLSVSMWERALFPLMLPSDGQKQDCATKHFQKNEHFQKNGYFQKKEPNV